MTSGPKGLLSALTASCAGVILTKMRPLALILFSAGFALALTPAKPSPIRQALAQALEDSDASAAPLRTLTDRMDVPKKVVAKKKLDQLERDALSPNDLAELSRAYVLLGFPGPGADAGLSLQQREPKRTEGLDLAAYAKIQQQDYSSAVALAKEALKIDPGDRDAMTAYRFADGRQSPAGASPASAPQAVRPANLATAMNTQDPARPYRLPIKVRATSPPPDIAPDFVGDSPVPRHTPFIPLAIGGALLFIGIGLSVKHAQDRAVDAVEQGSERALGKTAGFYQKAKDIVQEHPYAAGTAAVGGIALCAWLAAPAIVGGGPTLLAAGTSGATVPAAAATAAVSPHTALASAAAIALAVGGDHTGPNKNEPATENKPLSDEEKSKLEAEANSPDPADKGGKLTKAGRNLVKHSPRPGSSLPESSGSPEQINNQAAKLVREIFSDIDQVIRHPSQNWGDVIDVISKSGRGIRYSNSGKFLYFLG